ncbi:MAG: hypothetical protein ABI148_04830 [Ginsengibacter sp.]
MNISITSQKRNGYLFIESKGTIENVDELMAHSRMIYDEISKHDLKKILIYEPETSLPLDLVAHFNLVKNYIEQYPPDIREFTIAVVVAEAFKEVASTWETICQSRGLQYFVFTSLEDAINCLIEE